MKKLAGAAAAGALLLSMATPAFAYYYHHNDNDVTVRNWASVRNTVRTQANSGMNEIGGMCVGGGTIRTGVASAASTLFNDVNFTQVGGAEGDVTVYNGAMVGNRMTTQANSGMNDIGGKFVWGGSITSGAAGAAGYVDNVVNTNIVY